MFSDLNVLLAKFTLIGITFGFILARFWEYRRSPDDEYAYLQHRMNRNLQNICDEFDGKLSEEDFVELNMNMSCQECGQRQTCEKCNDMDDINRKYASLIPR